MNSHKIRPRDVLMAMLCIALPGVIGSCQLIATLEDAPESGVQCDDTLDNDLNGATDCDDANCINTAICQSKMSTCGDRTVQRATEQCDDGNTMPGDGCSITCQIETGLDRPVQRISPPSLNCTTVSSNGGRKLAMVIGKYAAMLCGPDVYVARTTATDMPFGPAEKIDFQSPAPFREVEIVDAGTVQHIAGIANDLLYYARSTNGGVTWSNIKLLPAQPPLGKSISVAALGTTVAIAVSGPGTATQVFVNRGTGAATWSQLGTAGFDNSQFNMRVHPIDGKLFLLGSSASDDTLTFAASGNNNPFAVTAAPTVRAKETSWAGFGDQLFFIGDAVSVAPETVGNISFANLTGFTPLNPPLPPQSTDQHRSISAASPELVFVAQVDDAKTVIVIPVGIGPPLPTGVVARFGTAPHVAALGLGYVVTWTADGQVFSTVKVSN